MQVNPILGKIEPSKMMVIAERQLIPVSAELVIFGAAHHVHTHTCHGECRCANWQGLVLISHQHLMRSNSSSTRALESEAEEMPQLFTIHTRQSSLKNRSNNDAYPTYLRCC